MKNNRIIICLLVAILLIIGVTIFFTNKDNSTTDEQSTPKNASMGVYFDPANIDTKVGDDFSVAVKENSGSEPVNVVSLKISFDPSVVQYDSFETSGAFSLTVETKAENGVATIVRATTSEKSGENIVGNIKFKSIKSSQTKLDTSGSEIVSANTNKIIDSQFGTAVVNVK